MTLPAPPTTDAHLLVTLRTLELDFGVDISGAEGLSGDALRDWVDDADDVLFERLTSERSRERDRS